MENNRIGIKLKDTPNIVRACDFESVIVANGFLEIHNRSHMKRYKYDDLEDFIRITVKQTKVEGE